MKTRSNKIPSSPGWRRKCKITKWSQRQLPRCHWNLGCLLIHGLMSHPQWARIQEPIMRRRWACQGQTRWTVEPATPRHRQTKLEVLMKWEGGMLPCVQKIGQEITQIWRETSPVLSAMVRYIYKIKAYHSFKACLFIQSQHNKNFNSYLSPSRSASPVRTIWTQWMSSISHSISGSSSRTPSTKWTMMSQPNRTQK